MNRIDLNCDMGESFGPWRMGADAEVMPWVTSANTACGFHAGDASIMRQTVTAAVAADVRIGAHVGLPDLAGFGRRVMAISAQEAYDITIVQIGGLQAVAHVQGGRVAHMKPHGALYHMAENDEAIADALVRAVHDIDADMRLVGRSGGRLVTLGEAAGLRVIHEVFADRRYLANGALMSRMHAEAVIDDIDLSVRQAVELACDGRVATVDGAPLRLRADSLCVHGDRSNAGHYAQALHQSLREAGVELRSPD